MPALPVPDYETIPRFAEIMKGIDATARAEALSMFLAPFQKRYRRTFIDPPIDFEARIGAGDDLLRTLQEEGCATTAIGAADKARLLELTGPLVQEVQARMDAAAEPSVKTSQMKLDPEVHADIFEHARAVLDAAHVFAAAGAYAAAPVTLGGLAVQVNTARATRQRYGEIDEAGLPPLATRYLHLDSGGWPWTKALIYLSDVPGMDQGPFRFVVGSHRVCDEFELIVRKTNDKLAISWRDFLALPPAFRLYTDVGNYVDPDSPGARDMLAKERAICGRDDLILFDYNGVHRGGFVREGSRWMMQCSLVAA